MEIRKILRSDVPELINFGLKVYPTRKTYYPALINFLFNEEFPGTPSGIILEENNEIKGQNLCTPMSLILNGTKKDLYWGHDLIVDEKLRNENWGVDILLACQKHFPGHCATGSGPEALKMALKLKYTLVGEIRKYVLPSSIVRLPINLLPSKREWPYTIGNFKLIDSTEELLKPICPNNAEIIEVERNILWINWRFFNNSFRNYWFYQNPEGDYFIVRIINRKGIKMLLVSDYRCSLNNSVNFESIINAVRKLANYLHIPFILCSSSHRTTDIVLEKYHAKSIGRPRPIIFPKQLKDWIDKDKIENREYCFITFGDSDGEWNW